MAKASSREDFLARLNEVKEAMHELHPDNTARLEQFDAHIATVAMCVDHLFDESARSKEG